VKGLAIVLAVASTAAYLAIALPSAASEASYGITSEYAHDVERLAKRMPKASASAIARIIATARELHLPTAPIEATANEGLARGVAPERIVAAVQSKASALASARTALGGGSSDADLVAGASALGAGIHADSLARLRLVRPQSAVVPLVVMADLVARGAPGTVASGAVIQATRKGANDAALFRLRESIASDIGAGAAPTDAILLRTRALSGTPAERPARASPTVEKPRLRTGDEP
jgi:hypothetical protein